MPAHDTQTLRVQLCGTKQRRRRTHDVAPQHLEIEILMREHSCHRFLSEAHRRSTCAEP